ncbi:hypothetical protein ACFQ2H_29910 [Streptomyces violaceoruber]
MLGELERQDVLAVDRLADGDDLGEAGVLLGGAQDLLAQAAAAAVRAEDAVGGALDPLLGLGGQGVLGEVDALLPQRAGLLPGEVQLDGGGPPVGHLLAEFVAVLAGRQQQGYLLLGDVGAEDPHFVRVRGPRVRGLCLGDGREARSADQERADGEDRSRSSSHEPPRWGLSDRPASATAANRCQAHDSS